MRTNRVCRFAGLLGLALAATVTMLPGTARGQALANRVPANAVIYVGWKGGDNLGAAYETSQLKGVMDAANVKQQVTALLTRGVDDAMKRGDRQGAGAKVFREAVEMMGQYPTAFYFGGMDLTDPDHPQPKMAVLSETGKDSANALADKLTKAIADAPDKQVPTTAKVVGNFLLVSTGETGKDIEDLMKKEGGAALATDKEFVAALGQVQQKDPVIVAFVNGKAMVQMVNDMVGMGTNQRAQQIWPRALDMLGLEGIKNMVVTGGFDGRQWSTQAFVKLAKDRVGLAGLLDAPAMSDGALKMVPKSATWAGVSHFDGPRLMGDLRDGAGRADERGAKQFDWMLAQVKNFMGVDIQKDLLAALGDEWVYYGTPEAVGNAVRGATVINKVKDEKALARALDTLADFANGLIAQRGGPDSKVTIKSQKVGDLDVTVLTLPDATPSWTVTNGYFVVSMSPQGVQSAVENLAKPGPSILENEDYTALMKKLGVAKPSTVTFVDLPLTAGDSYELLMKLSARLPAEAGDKGAPFTLPTLDKIKPWLSPSASASWTDKAGWHMKELSPFPGSGILGGGNMMLKAAATGQGMGAMGQARGNAQQAAQTTQLKQIGMGLMVYQSDNGAMPKDLGAFVGTGYIGDDATTLKMLAGPNAVVPAEVLKGTKEEKAAWVNKNTIYIYLGAGKKMAAITKPAETVLAYEKLDLPTSRRGVNILFADGHVELVPRAKAEEMSLK